MFFYKKRKFGRRSFRRRRFRKSFKSKLKRTVKTVKAMVQSAYTYQPTAQLTGSSSGLMISAHSQSPTSAGNALVSLTTIPAGAGESSRLGNRISLGRLFIRGYTAQTLANDAITLGDLPIGRILIWLVRDNANEALNNAGSNSDLDTILQNFGVSNPFLPYLRPEFRSKIKILADIKLNLQNCSTVAAVTSVGTGRVQHWKRTINLRKHCRGPTTYSGNTGGPTEQVRNHIFIGFIQVPTVTLQGSMTSVWMHRLSFLP